MNERPDGAPGARFLVLLTDAFGGWGGIAKFNRDFLGALTSHPAVREVAAIPRGITGPLGELPPKLDFRVAGSRGLAAFAVQVLRASVADRRYDAVICGHINLAPFAWVAATLHRAPMILVIHGIDAWRPTSRAIANVAARRSNAVISVSRVTLGRFRKWAGPRAGVSFILPNTVTLERFGPGPKPDDLLDRHGLRGRTVLMTLARLDVNERYKGIDEVMSVLAELAVSEPRIAYLIAGDGGDRPRLEAEARRLRVADRVVFAGVIPEDRKADYYRLADAFVMPGRGEGFGIVYLEALACGIPTVGSTLDGSRDALMDGRLGILVNPDDREDLMRGIRGALARPRGVVPEGLSEFSSQRYEERVHEIVKALLTSARA